MLTLLMVLSASFVLGLLLTPAARALAARCGLVDQPDGRRKMHARAVPVSGGVAVFLAACTALATVSLWSRWLGDRLAAESGSLLGLLLASAFICSVGLVDDFRVLRGRHKLVGQFVAVGIVLATGVVVRNIRLFDHDIELGLLAYPFTAFWLLGAINSLNLIDGMDGLLGCLGSIIALAVGIMAALAGRWVPAAVSFALAGALLAFLCFNFPPASIFLGDCGSMLVGLVIGVLAINSSMKGPATVALATPAAMFAIPIFDTLAAIVRRGLTGRSIYTTDRGHIHHCLLRYGMSTRKALLVLSFFCLVMVLVALASVALNSELVAVISVITVAYILIFTRLFGHAEFFLLKQRLLGMAFSSRRWAKGRNSHELEVRLQGSLDWQELWRSITAWASELELNAVCLDVNAPAIFEGYHARWGRFDQDGDGQSSWRAEIPLLVHGQPVGRLEITGSRDLEPARRKFARIAKLAEEVEHAIARLTAVPPELAPPLRVAEVALDGVGEGLGLSALDAEGSAVMGS